jgi:DNA polymerase-3 subunit beta
LRTERARSPILANVLLRTEGKGKILCAATDLSVTTVVTLSAKVEKEGALTVSARQLYEIIKGLPDEDVRVKATENNWAEIRSGKVEFRVVGMPDRDYPEACRACRRRRRSRPTRPRCAR